MSESGLSSPSGSPLSPSSQANRSNYGAPNSPPSAPPSAPYPAPSGGRHTRSMGPPPPVADPHARGGRPPAGAGPHGRGEVTDGSGDAWGVGTNWQADSSAAKAQASRRRATSFVPGTGSLAAPPPAPAPRRRRPPSGIPPRTAPRSPTSSTPCPRRRGAAPRSPPSTPPTNPGFTTEPARRRPRRRRPPAPRTAITSPAEANNTGANNTRGTANTTGVPPGPRRGRSGTRARRPGMAPPRGSARTRTKCFTGVRRRRRTTARGARRRR